MPLLNEHVVAETRSILAAMREPVLMTCFTQADCHACHHVVELAGEVAALAPALRVAVLDLLAEGAAAARLGVSRAPALALSRPGDARAPVRYLGLPSGHEFGAFLRTLVLLSTGQGLPGVDAAAVAPITRPAVLKVFVLAACPRCPELVYLCNCIAAASALVTVEVILADAFPDLVSRYQVGAVPKVVINETTAVLDALPPAALIAKIAAS